MVYRTLKAAIFIGLLTLAAGQYAYNAADRAALERLAQASAQDGDPLTTGSVGGTAASRSQSWSIPGLPSAANAVRLDPCEDIAR